MTDVTDEDEQAAWELAQAAYRTEPNSTDSLRLEAVGLRAALESARRPGGLTARAVAAELERLANGTHLPLRSDLLRLAAEWREGRR